MRFDVSSQQTFFFECIYIRILDSEGPKIRMYIHSNFSLKFTFEFREIYIRILKFTFEFWNFSLKSASWDLHPEIYIRILDKTYKIRM